MDADQQSQSRRDRFVQKVRSDEEDIQDWLNGNGALVLGGALVFIGLFAIYALVFAR